MSLDLPKKMIPDNKVYLAGPMTGYPKFNFPLFDRAAAELRALGFEVTSPAELDNEESRAAAMASEWGDPEEYHRLTGLTWADFLARDVKLIADSGFDSIVCLPGWRVSRGARLETFVGKALHGIPVFEYDDGHIVIVPLIDLISAWSATSRGALKSLIAERDGSSDVVPLIGLRR